MRRLSLLAACACVLVPRLARADAGALDPNATNLPSGPGSIEGFGQGHTLSPASARPGLAYPIELPAARGGERPELALRYQAGAGAGVVGLDWTLDLPRVERSVRQGLPGPDDPVVLALRGVPGGGELLEVAPGRYRLEHETSARYELRTRPDGGFDLHARDGRRWVLGSDAGTREGGREGPSAWLVARQIDAVGNESVFEWARLEGSSRPLLERVSWVDGAAELRLAYEARPDVIVDARAGIRQELGHRLVALETTFDGAMIRRHELRYTHDGALPVSRLAAIEAVADDGTRLPTWRMRYGGGALGGQPGAAIELGRVAAMDPQGPGRALIDVDGDGATDLLDGATAGAWRWRRNAGGRAFEAWASLDASPSIALDGAGSPSRWMDVDGDGVADLVVQQGTTGELRAFLGGRGEAGTRAPFSEVIPVPIALGADLDAPSVVAADLDLDGRVDLYRVSGGDAWWWRADPEGVGFLPPLTLPAPPLGFVPGDPGVMALDLDGDRLRDLVRVDLARGEISVARGLGRGRFGDPESIEDVPTLPESADWRMRDLNGDGTADLLVVGKGRVQAWSNLAGRRLVSMRGFEWPTLRPGEAVAVVDVDANGTADLLRVDVASGDWSSWPLLEDPAGLIARFENGLGYELDFAYDTAAAAAQRAAEAGAPWSRHSPVAESLLRRSEERDGHGWRREVEIEVRDPYWSRRDLASRGFAEVTERRASDDYLEARTLVRRFHLGEAPGEADDVLAGELLEERVYSGIAAPDPKRLLSRELHTLAAVSDDVGIVAARRVATDRWAQEGREDPEAARSRETFVYDDWGNPVEIVRSGRVDPLTGLDGPYVGDEQIERLRYARPPEGLPGPMDRVAERVLVDAAGEVVLAQRWRYDGEGGVGLGLGELLVGLVSREQVWVEGDRWIDTVKRVHDEHGHPVRIEDGEGGVVSRRFDSFGLHAEIERFDLDGRSELEALVRETSWDPGRGLRTAVTDPSGSTWRANYDGLGRVTAIYAPDDEAGLPTWRYRYFFGGAEAGEPDPTVQTWRQIDADTAEQTTEHLDGLGRVRAVVMADDSGAGAVLVRALRYDAEGGEAVVIEGAELGAEALAPGGALDPLRWAELLPRATAEAREVFRDALGRELLVREADGRQHATSYAPGEVVRRDSGDLAGSGGYADAPRVERRDGLGRLVSVVDQLPEGEARHDYGWDAADRLVEYVDPEGWTSIYRHDGAGRLREIEGPDVGVVSREYDRAGRLLSSVDARGARVSRSYDRLGRLLTVDALSADGTSEGGVRYTWDRYPGETGNDQAGRMVAVEDDAGSLRLTHDARGREVARVRSFRRAGGGEIELARAWRYDGGDRVTAELFPDGGMLTREYSARGLERRVGDFAPEIDYDPRGRWTRIRLGEAATMHRELDPVGRITGIEVSPRGGGASLFDLRYEFDVAGHLARVRDGVGATAHSPALDQRLEHDDLGRLVAVEAAFGARSWGYGAEGNLRMRDGNELGYGEGDRGGPHALTDLMGQRLRYDAAGQLVEVTGEGPLELASITWDAHGRPAVTRGPDGAYSEHVYDHEGQRAIRRDYGPDGALREELIHFGPEVELRGDTLIRWIYAAGQRVAEAPTDVPDGGFPPLPLMGGMVVPAGAVGRRRRRDVEGRRRPGLAALGLIALFGVAACTEGPEKGSSGPEALRVDARTRFIVEDRLGSGAIRIAPDGAVVGRAGHEAYGEPWFAWSAAGEAPMRREFAGHAPDPVGGLVRMGARHYVPTLGRWASPDPLFTVDDPSYALDRPGERNPYRYAGNGPVGAVDPEGLATADAGVALSVTVGGRSFSVSVGLAADDDGNVGLTGSVGTGRGLGSSAGISVFGSLSDADTITSGVSESRDVGVESKRGSIEVAESRDAKTGESTRTFRGSGSRSIGSGAVNERKVLTGTLVVDHPVARTVMLASPVTLLAIYNAKAASLIVGR